MAGKKTDRELLGNNDNSIHSEPKIQTEQPQSEMFSGKNTIKREVLHKTRISTGSHTYFLELKEAVNGSKYIIIDQSKKVGDTFRHTKIRIFEDEILEFYRQFENMVKLMVEGD
jgi:hypothetical protein